MTAATPAPGPLVVGFDGGDASGRALDDALREAPRRGASVIVLVVAPFPYEPTDPFDPAMAGFAVATPIPPEGPAVVQPVLGEARRRLEEAGVEGTVEWSIGDPAPEILRVADERGASAIFVGKHHHSALTRLLGGDTAADVVREAPCEVLVSA